MTRADGFQLHYYRKNTVLSRKISCQHGKVGDGTGNGSQASLTADNATPWCVLAPADRSGRSSARLDARSDKRRWILTGKTRDGSPLPLCPAVGREPTAANRFKAPVGRRIPVSRCVRTWMIGQRVAPSTLAKRCSCTSTR